MCYCLSFLMAHPAILQSWIAWRRALISMYLRIRLWRLTFPTVEVDFVCAESCEESAPTSPQFRTQSNGFLFSKCRKVDGTIYIIKAKQETTRDRKSAEVKKTEPVMNGTHSHNRLHRFDTNGGTNIASLFTQQGGKGINQDAMLVWENFAARADTIFCGVFDGHGQDGHLVARNVRDNLPLKLASCWQALHRAAEEPGLLPDVDCVNQTESSVEGKATRDPYMINAWKNSFMSAYKIMDRELLVGGKIDCICSGTTAVTLVKQGNDLIIGNVGDSRAVLGMKADDHSLLALQLTVDLKPNLPREAERIRKFKGRVFALRDEPSVKRVWLPHKDTPGLAMARALGDYCLKSFGVISEPEITYRRLTKKDKFIVLATDGVWDVLSNEQVVQIVDSAPVRSLAAKAVVQAAVHVWGSTYSTSKVDDCAVICLFLDNCGTESNDAAVRNVTIFTSTK